MNALAQLLHRVDELQEAIAHRAPIAPELLKKINYKLRLEWNYHSNAMEGGTLTKEETQAVMLGNITVENKPLVHLLEMRGHDNVVKEVLKMGRGELHLSERRIKELHQAIVQPPGPSSGAAEVPGQWKMQNNHILFQEDEKVEFLDYKEVPQAMHQLSNWLSTELDKLKNDREDSLHPVVLAAEYHLRFVTIHPFFDGNGRLARILSNLILASQGLPPIIVKTEEKDRYNRLLFSIQALGAPSEPWYSLTAQLVQRNQELIISALNGEPIDEPEDWRKELRLLRQQVAVTTISHPRLDEELIRTTLVPTIMNLYEALTDLKNELEVFFEVSYFDNYIEFNNDNDSIFESIRFLDYEHYGSTEYSLNLIFENYLNSNSGEGLRLVTTLGIKKNNFNIKFSANNYYIFESKDYSFSHPISIDEINSIKKSIANAIIMSIKSKEKGGDFNDYFKSINDLPF